MFRLLTSLPPGQVRFTIVDPIGIGRNFGAFMHLADFDGALVTSQVWTDPRQIEERLADLAAHMETVTQKYLRNEYATIEEYNAVAEEVAEPYRVLVVADFPTKFDEKSAARLAAIAAGGVPCGVLTLVAVDLSKPLPSRFSARRASPLLRPPDLGRRAARLVWDDPDFGQYPAVARRAAARRVRHAADPESRRGRQGRQARRGPVRVHQPRPTAPGGPATAAAGIDVPLGKAGATKRQHFTLGHGTSQHVLIAGRTGSGKSTLMHALITNLALNYSPDEIDLYLIDFKKGVEFKVYATHELPHASVVAIESEREFGISVLERLDAELRLRADRFRDAGVQDVNGYRNVPGTPPLPRILLIVDEFQEFFVEEDKLAQEAAPLARPPGPPGPSLRHPHHPRLAEPGRRVHPGPEHAGPDGRADRASVQRERRPPDPEREQHRAPRCSRAPARRSTTTPTARPRATTSSRSSGSRTSAARLI